jgi:hypothetical protein
MSPSNNKSSNNKMRPTEAVLTFSPEKALPFDENKNKFLSFKLRLAANDPESPRYTKYIRTFEQGTPQQWIDLMNDFREMWIQNGVDEPQDRVNGIRTLVKGTSLTAFEVSLETARTDPENLAEPLELTNEHVVEALAGVAEHVFPHRALDKQKRWMNREMRKPFDLSTRLTAAALCKMNNSLKFFPGADEDTKFSDEELVQILEVSLPRTWKDKFDLDGFTPSDHTMGELILKCEAIERNEAIVSGTRNQNDNNNKKSKNSKNGTDASSGKKSGNKDNRFFCTECGRNATHDTEKCYKLKNQKNRANQARDADADKKPPAKKADHHKRSFRKEANAIVRKAGKNGKQLDVLASALKRERARLEKKEKKRAEKHEESDDSSRSDVSMNNLDAPIPKKKVSFKKKGKRPLLEEERAFLSKIAREESMDEDSDDSDAVKPVIDLSSDSE